MPPAMLAWLDYSEADQRRAREIVAMFSQRESRDELGLGRIREALSETLFPGTSVLLTPQPRSSRCSNSGLDAGLLSILSLPVGGVGVSWASSSPVVIQRDGRRMIEFTHPLA